MPTSLRVHPSSLTVSQLLILLLGRFTFNTGFRIIYPLLPVLADGLDVSLEMASLLVTVQVAVVLLSPLGGRIADVRGERFCMLFGLTVFTLGALICALTRQYGLFLLGYALIGLGTALYMPSVQAYASVRSDYSQRARVLGILELSWAFAALVGVAGLTVLIGRWGSWAPAFWVLGGLGALVWGVTLGLPDDSEGRRIAGRSARRWLVSARIPILAALALIFFEMLASELIFVVYASWLQRDFGATTAQLGLIFGVLGLIELAGSLAATLFTDRFGKRRAVVSGFLLVVLFQALLPLSSGHWGLFLVLFLLFDLCFEFAVVSSFPLLSGLTDEGRGTVLALGVAMSGLGRVVGSLAGPQIFGEVGFWAIGLLAAVSALIGALLCLGFVREGQA